MDETNKLATPPQVLRCDKHGIQKHDVEGFVRMGSVYLCALCYIKFITDNVTELQPVKEDTDVST